LGETVDRVASVIKAEESNFFATIDDGLGRIERVFADMRSGDGVRIDGGVAAELYQTYGVPPELFESLAAEHNFAFDWDGYERAMQQHGEASGKVQHSVMGARGPIDSLKQAFHATEFVGYDTTESEATVLGIVAGEAPDDHLCDRIEEVGHEQAIRVVLDRTPFYGESGGQVGDTGTIRGEGFEFEVADTQKDGGLVIHSGHLRRGVMQEGQTVKATVDTARRDGIRRAHSATHILHYALQKNLGTHAQQQGSKVDDDWLRFDFTNLTSVDAEQLAAITTDVAERIDAAEPVKWETLPLADARQQGAMMLFGEKYPDPVRMVSMGASPENTFSKELCGGTHLTSTGQVEQFEILHEEGVSAGTRRIVAITGRKAAEHAEQTATALHSAAKTLGVETSQVPQATEALLARQRGLKKRLAGGGATKDPASPVSAGDAPPTIETQQLLANSARLLSVAPLAVPERLTALKSEVDALEQQLAARAAAGPLTADELLKSAETIGGVTVVVADLPGVEPNLMRQLIDQIRQKVASSAVLLASKAGDDKVTIVAGVSKDVQKAGGNAGKWIGPVAKAVGGGGGGRPDLAQAGGKLPAKLPEALQVAKDVAREMFGA
jgi:alanyl-tRNA synthetase